MSDGTQAKIRIWHAARDAYHCAFRFMRLLSVVADHTVEFERLRIFDLYLLFPPLLHNMSMPLPMKSEFRELQIPKMDQIFARLPSAASALQELQIYQTSAANYLAAKEILQRDPLRKGIASLSDRNIPAELAQRLEQRNSDETSLLNFLVTRIGQFPLSGTDNIYRRAALPSRRLVS